MVSRHKILVLDDDQDDLDLLSHIYSSYTNQDVDLEIMKSCEELFLYLKINPPPDMIILDQNMPRLTGLEILKIIKNESEFNDTKLIIFSTVADKFFTNKAMNLGASAVFEKPMFYDKMVDVFLEILSFDQKDIREGVNLFTVK